MDEVMCPYNKLIYSQTHGSSIHYLSLDRAVQSPPPRTGTSRDSDPSCYTVRRHAYLLADPVSPLLFHRITQEKASRGPNLRRVSISQRQPPLQVCSTAGLLCT